MTAEWAGNRSTKPARGVIVMTVAPRPMVMAIAIAIDKLAPAAVNVEMESSLICLPWKIAVEKPKTQDAIKMGGKKSGVEGPTGS